MINYLSGYLPAQKDISKYTRYGDDPNKFKDQWGQLYDYDGEKYTASTNDRGTTFDHLMGLGAARPDQDYADGAWQGFQGLYSKYGLDPMKFMQNQGGFGFASEMLRPTELNGKLYVPAGEGYFSANEFDAKDPELAAFRKQLNPFVDANGDKWLNPQDAWKLNELQGRNMDLSGDFLDKFGPMAMTGLFLGPIAGAAGASGGSAFADLMGQYGINNPFSSFGGGGSGFGGGGAGGDLVSWYQAAGYTPAQISQINAGLGALGGAAGGGTLTEVQQWAQNLGGLNPDGTINWSAIDASPTIQSLGSTAGAAAIPMAGATAAGAASSGLLDLIKKMSPNAMASLLGSGIQGISSLLAANAQRRAGQQANDTLNQQYWQNRADLTPYRQAGYNALDRLTAMTTPGNQFTAMQADPGYQWRVDEATKALDNRLKAGGKFYSGNALRAGQELSQGLASQEFGNVFNRNAALSGIGQTATNTGIQSGNALTGLLANNQTDMGNARASGYMGVGNAVQGGLNNYNNANMTNALLQLLAGRGF